TLEKGWDGSSLESRFAFRSRSVRSLPAGLDSISYQLRKSVHAAPSITFELVSTGTEDIRLIETNNQRKPQDVEGLPLEPKRKRRRRRKRKRPQRRKGKANKRRPGHSPVTPPRRQDNARRQAAKTHESFIKEFRTFIYSNAAKYCPASGFDTNWHRKGIG
ncbi:hypothetical protein THAOC_25686, partial [Thalassiosira oceanica]